MNSKLRLFLILFPFASSPACDEADKDDDESSAKSNGDKDDDDPSKSNNDDDDDDDDDDVPLWDCYCEAECDDEVLEYEELVCSDAETLDIAIDIAVAECAVELEDSCAFFDCYCDCEEDPDLVCD